MRRRLALATTLGAAAALWLGGAVAPASAQQTGRIQGLVTAEATGRPLAGAQVYVVGTSIGTVTTTEGRYVLPNLPARALTLRVQMIGYGTADRAVDLAASQNATVDFALRETAVALDEIVVTGTAADVRKKEVGNAVATITARELETLPVVNPQDILAGRAVGVTIMQNSGQPGAGGTIKVRGTNTVTQDAEPLIYIDGVRIYNESQRNGWGGRTMTSPLQDIPAEDIQRIEVVKGAAATTVYGTEASGGVIQIFTKRGSAGTPIWSAEISTGVSLMGDWIENDPTQLFTKCGNKEELYGLKMSGKDVGKRVYFEDPTCPADGDWAEPGETQSYNLSVRGGSDNVTYFLSGNYGNAHGVLPTGGAKDGGFRGNFAFSPFEKLNFALNSSYNRRDVRWAGDGNNSEGFLLNVGRGPNNYLKGGKGSVAEQCEAIVEAGKVCTTNRYLFDAENFTHVDHFVTGVTTNFDPTERLSNRLSVGWDYVVKQDETTLPFGFLGTENGYFWDENTRHTKLSVDYSGSFRNNFTSDLVSTFTWGGQVFRDNHRWTEVDVSEFAGPGEQTLLSGAQRQVYDDVQLTETSAGFFLQEQVGWKDRLFVTGGLRIDGNSAFGEDYGLQKYPKVSLAYVLSDHEFWPTQWFETFKLRSAMGESGKAPGAFARLRTWTPISGDDGQPGFTPGDLGNPKVGPERTREIETGFDASFLDGRFGVEMTYFNARTFDALVGVTLPPSNGILRAQQQNVGEIQNWGTELGLTAAVIRRNNFDWRMRFTMTNMDSEVLDLDGGLEKETSFYTGLKSEVREGYPMPMYFGNRIMNPDEFADPVVKSDTVLGRVYPNKLWSVGATFTVLNNIQLDALFEHQGGHYLPNYTGYQNARRGAWRPCYAVQEKMVAFKNGQADALNDVTALERGRCAISRSVNGSYSYNSDYWVERADFTKLRSLSITYSLPQSLVRWGRSASITLAGRNLYTWTDYSGSDPEVQDAADQVGDQLGSGDFGRRDYYTIPSPRTFVLSARVGW